LSRIFAPALMLLIVFLYETSPAQASEVSVQIQTDGVMIKIESSFYQNMTVFPQSRFSLSGENLTNAASKFESAIRVKFPQASVREFSMSATSNSTWMNVSVRLELVGVQSRRGDVLNINCSWKSFAMRQDILVSNVSLNLVGQNYVLPLVEKYGNRTETIFYKRGTMPMTLPMARNEAGNATLFEFTSFELPVEKWSKTYNFSTQSATWEFSAQPTLDLLIKFKEDNVTKHIRAEIDPKATITARGHATVKDDIITLDVSQGSSEVAMIGIFVTLLTIAILAHVQRRKSK